MGAADGSLSNSSTSTSLDTVVVEREKDTAPSKQLQRSFSPILETDDIITPGRNINISSSTTSSSNKKFVENPRTSSLKGHTKATSKPSLKGSKVSFENPANESTDDDSSFEDRRGQFQQKKAYSVSATTDRKGILKVKTLFISFFLQKKANKIYSNYFIDVLGPSKYPNKRRPYCFSIEKTCVIRYKKCKNIRTNSTR